MIPRSYPAWGFTYNSNIVWHKVRKDGGSDGRGVGFYFRNVTELDLIDPLPLLPYTAEIDTIAGIYTANKVMPEASGGDAHHLALASFHRCDTLVTWNCKHIANANKATHIRLINSSLGLHTPELLTPLELLETEP